jgi:hypothetical protein
MLQIENNLVSLDICEKNFFCDLNKCKGACCVQGDSGAPLKSDEAEVLNELYPVIKRFLRDEGIEAINSLGKHVIDSDGDIVTPLVNNKECAYAIFENGIAKCGIEKAYLAGEITFRKPISCHLYPIRVTKYSSFEAINYHQWEICKPAIELGNKNNIPLYIFLTDALKREYGDAWFEQLKIASDELKQSGMNP